MLAGVPQRPKRAPKGKKPKPTPKRSSNGRGASKKVPTTGGDDFRAAFASLLRSRKLTVPKGLLDAPPEAYASQPASFVDQLEQLPDAELKRFAEKVATHVRRQQARARAEWDTSPLIAELRRRRLDEPPCPLRPVGASVSLAKPLKEWTDKQLLKAARDWSKLGSA